MTLSRIVPADKRDDSDVQRWQLPQFDSNSDYSGLLRGGAGQGIGPGSADGHRSSDGATDELSAEQERGYQDGLKQAEQESAQQLEELQSMITALQNPSQILTDQVAEELLNLAIEISRQILGRELSASASDMETLIETALAQMPAGEQETVITANTQDSQIIESALATLGGTDLKLTIDPALDSGNFVLKRGRSIIHGGIDAMLKRVASQFKPD